MTRGAPIGAVLLLLAGNPGLGRAQEGPVFGGSAASSLPDAAAVPAETTTESPIQIHGFLVTMVSGLVTGDRPAVGRGGDFLLGEERLRLELSSFSSTGEFFVMAKGDVFYDAVFREGGAGLREAWIGYTSGGTDIRAGRQILTWGVGDLLFINDVFPKDWESFFSGRPIDYIKLPIDGLRLRHSAGGVDAELVVIPFFTPDTLPSAERFPLGDSFAATGDLREERRPATYPNVEWALRLQWRLGEFDLSLYGDYGFWRFPSARGDDPSASNPPALFYPRLSVYGASAQVAIFRGILSLETGYYDSRGDRSGGDPSIPNSEARLLAGYQWQAGEELTAGVQVYGELMSDAASYFESLPPGSPRRDRLRGVVSMRLTKWLGYQTTRLSLFLASSPTDEDYFLQAEMFHKLSDSVGVALGTNIFGGRLRTTAFGRLDESDSVFANVRFDF